MAKLRQYDAAEQELLRALAHTIEEKPGSIDVSKCPSPHELKQLARGACASPSRRAELLAHLADCNHCIQIMRRIRERRVVTQRALVVVGVFLVAAAVWIWATHGVQNGYVGTVTLDLRAASPTRGGEKPSARQTAVLSRKANRLRIILPPGGEGTYDAEFLPADEHGSALARAFASTRIENRNVVLDLPINVFALEPGNYSLALRRNEGERMYYSVALK